MKKIFQWLLIFICISCTAKKNSSESDESVQKSIQSAPAVRQDLKQNDIYYTKNLMNIGYINRDDVGKKWQQLAKGSFHRLGIGVKVECKQVEFDGEKEIFLVEMDNSKKVWMDMNDLAKGVIVIDKPSVATYEIPDTDWVTQQNVHQGDLGYIITNYNDWLFVDFRGYSSYAADEKKVWIGRKWIRNSDYIMDGDLAGQAMYLYFAYYQLMNGAKGDAATNINYAKKITSNFPFMNKLLDSVLNDISSTDKDTPDENTAE